MFIDDPRKLAKALETILTDQVAVRYAVNASYGTVVYVAQLVLFVPRDGKNYLARLSVNLSVGRSTNITTYFSVADLVEQQQALHNMLTQWSRRSFDDWMHDQAFMGAYGVFRDGMPYTSIKMDAADSRWRFLTGALLGELDKYVFKYETRGHDPVSTQAAGLMKKRFSAFAAQNECAWAGETFTAA